MTKRPLPPKQEGRIRLRLLEERDLPLTLAWRNQDSIRKWFFNSDLIDFKDHLKWFKHYQELNSEFVFLIEEIYDFCRPIGQVSLYKIQAHQAIFGRLMIGDKEAQGQGLATAATNLALQIAFDDFSLDIVTLEVKHDNTAAFSIYEKFGFITVSRSNGMVQMKLTREAFEFKS